MLWIIDELYTALTGCLLSSCPVRHRYHHCCHPTAFHQESIYTPFSCSSRFNHIPSIEHSRDTSKSRRHRLIDGFDGT
ncbi:hypothetical protein HETIRDRAFT_323296 [Heterobasidion irregulare TC 32-1]|uniref:Uncharacterized protein n=1 Tax=Heterobasidion irregulare (strain TC 32-1) TaxID=747525 RepID=W4K060_HETIT|nr:uncharacterized protein HETIRDRAFT_323296 [Heterobasidion irregulare TC 32-1]ETW79208.1 hypothetical protein HETIRDRAFT_323296 [Heterobasidion irregulare TC 32-1]